MTPPGSSDQATGVPDPRKPGERPREQRLREVKSWTLLGFCILSFTSGLATGWTPIDPQVVDVVWSALFSAVAVVWVSLDAHERHLRVKPWQRVAVFLLPIVFVPWHLLRSRGWRGTLTIGVAVLYAAFAGVAFELGALAAN